jgi:hypothetical protein
MSSEKTLHSSLAKSAGAGVKPKAPTKKLVKSPATAPSTSPAAAPRTVKPKRVAKEPPRVAIPPIEPTRAPIAERYLSPEELQMERDRIYARLTSIANVIARPSPADYVVFEVVDPNVVHKRLVLLGIPPEVVQKYPKIQNGMRVFVRSARKNEEFLRALEQAAK